MSVTLLCISLSACAGNGAGGVAETAGLISADASLDYGETLEIAGDASLDYMRY